MRNVWYNNIKKKRTRGQPLPWPRVLDPEAVQLGLQLPVLGQQLHHPLGLSLQPLPQHRLVRGDLRLLSRYSLLLLSNKKVTDGIVG